MKTLCFACIIFLVILSCESYKTNCFYDIINENFLNFTDTVAYKSGTFFLIPGDSIIGSNANNKMIVAVDTLFFQSPTVIKSLIIELEKRNLIDYKELLKEEKGQSLAAIDLSRIKHTGKYNLISFAKSQTMKSKKLLGGISFGQPFIGEDKAIIVFTLQSSPKAGITNAYLLDKQNDKWKIRNVFELERW